MASSSVSQEDIDNDFELSSRRSRVRAARAHKITPPAGRFGESGAVGDDEGGDTSHSTDLHPQFNDLDLSPKPAARLKEKRNVRPTHLNKGKVQRDRRKLREKRRSTGVVHLPSTESTGGSTGEDELDDDEHAPSQHPVTGSGDHGGGETVLDTVPVLQYQISSETRRNTLQNEVIAAPTACASLPSNVPSTTNQSEERREFMSGRGGSGREDRDADEEDNSTLAGVDDRENGCFDLDSQDGASPPPPHSTKTEINDVQSKLVKAEEENRRLLSLLAEKDGHIAVLESQVGSLVQKLARSGISSDLAKLAERGEKEARP
ncbi:unnamed protein product [Cyprideis torosa]|uniref:Uncharacterized protein n=1 Tax=Cyprideis torosa TaxID=163714 RepID=A0A7R8ZLG0_9CRUS|nr:unnamed protein product [Cyprideis torosa]CAG0882184.1 unnamed protein product [Cyprideis torosa]